MVKIKQKINQELFIGYENDCWEKVFTVNDLKIRLFDIINNPLRNLKGKISEEDFNVIEKIIEQELKKGKKFMLSLTRQTRALELNNNCLKNYNYKIKIYNYNFLFYN